MLINDNVLDVPNRHFASNISRHVRNIVTTLPGLLLARGESVASPRDRRRRLLAEAAWFSGGHVDKWAF